MNKVFQVKFNRALGRSCVVSEIATRVSRAAKTVALVSIAAASLTAQAYLPIFNGDVPGVASFGIYITVQDTVRNSVVFGLKNNVTGSYSITAGYNNNVGAASLALGSGVTAKDGAIALGHGLSLTGPHIALASNSQLTGLTLEAQAGQATGQSSIIIGDFMTLSGHDIIALGGRMNTGVARNAVLLGFNSDFSVSTDPSRQISFHDSILISSNQKVSGPNSNSIVVGNSFQSAIPWMGENQPNPHVIAIGANIESVDPVQYLHAPKSDVNVIYLGSNTSTYKHATSAQFPNPYYGNIWPSETAPKGNPNGTLYLDNFSVGLKTNPGVNLNGHYYDWGTALTQNDRINLENNGILILNHDGDQLTRIEGVAAGLIGPQSTDAVNGGQMFALFAPFTLTNLSAQASTSQNQFFGVAANTSQLVNGIGQLVYQPYRNMEVAVSTRDVTAANGTPEHRPVVTLGSTLDAVYQNTTLSDGTHTATLDAQGLTFKNGNTSHTTIDNHGNLITGTSTVTPSTQYATLLGHAAQAGSFSTAVGASAVANPSNATLSASAIAIGSHAQATANHAIALGGSAQAQAVEAIALGTQVSVAQGIALGTGAQVNATGGVAIGTGAQAQVAQGVALGSGSIASTPAPLQDATFSGPIPISLKAKDWAGNANPAPVSVGAPNAMRRVQGVAPGLLSTTSTDAMTGAQMLAAQTALTKSLNPWTIGAHDVAPITMGGSRVLKTLSPNLISQTDGANVSTTLADTLTLTQNGQTSTVAPGIVTLQGTTLTVTPEGALVIGTVSPQPNGQGAVIVGTGEAGPQGVALGSNTITTTGIALGDQAKSQAGVTIGLSGLNTNQKPFAASSTGQGIAIGNGAVAFDQGVALGQGSKAVTGSVVIGHQLGNTAEKATKVGTNTSASDNAVAIGDNANANQNEVTFGNKQILARLEGIAPGLVSADSQDLINGAQVVTLAQGMAQNVDTHIQSAHQQLDRSLSSMQLSDGTHTISMSKNPTVTLTTPTTPANVSLGLNEKTLTVSLADAISLTGLTLTDAQKHAVAVTNDQQQLSTTDAIVLANTRLDKEGFHVAQGTQLARLTPRALSVTDGTKASTMTDTQTTLTDTVNVGSTRMSSAGISMGTTALTASGMSTDSASFSAHTTEPYSWVLTGQNILFAPADAAAITAPAAPTGTPSVSIVNNPKSLTWTDAPTGVVDVQNRLVQDAAAGLVSATSTDAVTGSQLAGLAQALSTKLGQGTVIPLTLQTTTGVSAQGTWTASNTLALQTKHNLTETISDRHIELSLSKTPSVSSVTLAHEGSQATLSSTDSGLSVNKPISVDKLLSSRFDLSQVMVSVPGDATVRGYTSIQGDTMTLGEAPSALTEGSLNLEGRRLQNIAPGRTSTDAVSGAQVAALTPHLNQAMTGLVWKNGTTEISTAQNAVLTLTPDQNITTAVTTTDQGAQVTVGLAPVLVLPSIAFGTNAGPSLTVTDGKLIASQTLAVGANLLNGENTHADAWTVGNATLSKDGLTLAPNLGLTSNTLTLQNGLSITGSPTNVTVTTPGSFVLAAPANAVLGAHSQADSRANALSVGSPTGLRRLMGIGAGQVATDAVNMTQLHNKLSTIIENDSTRIAVTAGDATPGVITNLHGVELRAGEDIAMSLAKPTNDTSPSTLTVGFAPTVAWEDKNTKTRVSWRQDGLEMSQDGTPVTTIAATGVTTTGSVTAGTGLTAASLTGKSLVWGNQGFTSEDAGLTLATPAITSTGFLNLGTSAAGADASKIVVGNLTWSGLTDSTDPTALATGSQLLARLTQYALAGDNKTTGVINPLTTQFTLKGTHGVTWSLDKTTATDPVLTISVDKPDALGWTSPDKTKTVTVSKNDEGQAQSSAPWTTSNPTGGSSTVGANQVSLTKDGKTGTLEPNHVTWTDGTHTTKATSQGMTISDGTHTTTLSPHGASTDSLTSGGTSVTSAGITTPGGNTLSASGVKVGNSQLGFNDAHAPVWTVGTKDAPGELTIDGKNVVLGTGKAIGDTAAQANDPVVNVGGMSITNMAPGTLPQGWGEATSTTSPPTVSDADLDKFKQGITGSQMAQIEKVLTDTLEREGARLPLSLTVNAKGTEGVMTNQQGWTLNTPSPWLSATLTPTPVGNSQLTLSVTDLGWGADKADAFSRITGDGLRWKAVSSSSTLNASGLMVGSTMLSPTGFTSEGALTVTDGTHQARLAGKGLTMENTTFSAQGLRWEHGPSVNATGISADFLLTAQDSTLTYTPEGKSLTLNTPSIVFNQAGATSSATALVLGGANDKQTSLVEGIANGVDDTDAVNVGQLNAVKTELSQSVTHLPLTLGEAKATVTNTTGINLTHDANLVSTVTDAQGTTVELNLAPTVTLTQDGHTTTLGTNGLTVGEHVSFSSQAVNTPSVSVGQNQLKEDGLVVGKTTFTTTGLKHANEVILRTTPQTLRLSGAGMSLGDTPQAGVFNVEGYTLTGLKNAVLSNSSTQAVTGQQLDHLRQELGLTTATPGTGSAHPIINQGAGNTLPTNATAPVTVIGHGNTLDGAGTTIGSGNTQNGMPSTVVGEGNHATGNLGTVIGQGNTLSDNASKHSSTTIGENNTTTGNDNTALGSSESSSPTHVTGNTNTTVGSGLTVQGDHNTVMANPTDAGQAPTVTGSHNTVAGNGTTVEGDKNTTLGTKASSTGSGNVAVGQDAQAKTQPGEGPNLAMGTGAIAEGDHTVAIGTHAHASGSQNVALGANSTASDRANLPPAVAGVISVGNDTEKRIITHVAPGSQATDAINNDQLHGMIRDLLNIPINVGETSTTIASARPLTVEAGRGMMLKLEDQAGRAQLTISTNPDLVANSITVGPQNQTTQIGEHGLAWPTSSLTRSDDTVSIVAPGVSLGTANAQEGELNLGNKALTGVAAGNIKTDSTDAVTQAQLTNLKKEAGVDNASGQVDPGNAVVGTHNGSIPLTVKGSGNTVFGKGNQVNQASNPGPQNAGNLALGQDTITKGKDTNTPAMNNVTTGIGTTSVGSNTVSQGKFTQAKGDNAIAQGNSAQAIDGGIAIGGGAKATGSNNVALGADSDAQPRDDLPAGAVGVVNMGNRVISNVAPGQEPNDLINKKQLDEAMSKIVGTNSGEIHRYTKEGRAGVANLAAIASLPIPLEPGRSTAALSMGQYRNHSSIGVGYGYTSDNGVMSIRVNAAQAVNGSPQFGGGLGFTW